MRIPILLALVAFSCDGIATAQSPVAHELGAGVLRFAVPASWRVVTKNEDPKRSTLLIDVPVSAAGKVKGNVVVTVFRGLGNGDLRSTTGPFVAALISGPVIGDTLLAGPDRRFLFWRGHRDGVPYAITDDFGWHAGTLVHISMALPLGKDVPQAWIQALSVGTRLLLASARLNGALVFPGWAAHPPPS